jgi:hypothetical protein
MNHNPQAFLALARHPLKFRLFLLSKLPSAYFSGLRVRYIDEKKCTVTVPYKWFSRNPFRSTYFACLAMAGEMSTGALGMAYVYERKPNVSMLVVEVRVLYHKKATGLTSFTCEDGKKFDDAVQSAIDSGEARLVTARSAGTNEIGELIAEMEVTWSFKPRSKQ